MRIGGFDADSGTAEAAAPCDVVGSATCRTDSSCRARRRSRMTPVTWN